MHPLNYFSDQSLGKLQFEINMDLDKLVAVSGLSGIFKMAVNRKNGLILQNIDTGKKNFYSSRKHQFTPLESISIYTFDDGIELGLVFKAMKEQIDENPPVSHKSSKEELRGYFEKILPTYDRGQVYDSDIKRLIKWFNFLNERDLLKEKVEEIEEPTAENTDVTGTEEA